MVNKQTYTCNTPFLESTPYSINNYILLYIRTFCLKWNETNILYYIRFRNLDSLQQGTVALSCACTNCHGTARHTHALSPFSYLRTECVCRKSKKDNKICCATNERGVLCRFAWTGMGIYVYVYGMSTWWLNSAWHTGCEISKPLENPLPSLLYSAFFSI